jgi:hypothetical protein
VGGAVSAPTLALPLGDEISAPGVYDLPDDVYHADPAPTLDGGSLSSSGAKKLLPPKTPAHFAWWRQHGQAPKAAFDFGHAAHAEVLGRGLPIDVLPWRDWRTKAAQTARAESYAAGRVPLLEDDHAVVVEMAAALREHPLASALLAPERGKAEQSLFWRHDRTGVWLRARLDHLPHPVAPGRRYVVADYKTADDASDDAFSRTAASYGYHLQQAFYVAGVRAVGVHPDPRFLFVVQEKAAPYLVNVVQLDDEAATLGRRRFDQAVNLFARCTRDGVWPGYGDGVSLVTLPRWVTLGEDLTS